MEKAEWEAKYEENKIEEYQPTHFVADGAEEWNNVESSDFEFKPAKPLSETLLATTQQQT